jgi:hypothetical protein
MEGVRPVRWNPDPQVSVLPCVRHRCCGPIPSGTVRSVDCERGSRTLQGIAASGPGRLGPGPWFRPGGGTEAPRSMVAEGPFFRKREAPLTVEGCRRTLGGPSPDPSVSTALHFLRLRRRGLGGHRQTWMRAIAAGDWGAWGTPGRVGVGRGVATARDGESIWRGLGGALVCGSTGSTCSVARADCPGLSIYGRDLGSDSTAVAAYRLSVGLASVLAAPGMPR